MPLINTFDQVREDSIQRLENGGIPVVAEQRLQALRGSASALFTTTLSVDEFALTKLTGLRPVSQVMGACTFRLPFGTRPGFSRFDPGTTHRLGDAAAWNATRDTALRRMSLEAVACGSHVVTGVSITHHVRVLDPDVNDYTQALECVATGTAMLREATAPASPARPDTVLTGLSAQDYWKLVQRGFDALGLVGCTIMAGRQPSTTTMNGLRLGTFTAAGRDGREIPEFSAVLADAYTDTIAELRAQASRLGAEGITGVSIERHQYPDRDHNRIVTVHATGTAIARRRSPGYRSGATPADTSAMTVRRLDIRGQRQ